MYFDRRSANYGIRPADERGPSPTFFAKDAKRVVPGCPQLLHYGISNSVRTFTEPHVTFSFRSQVLYPVFLTTTECSPGVTSMSDGVLPTKLPSIWMSALAGVDETEILFTEELHRAIGHR